MTDQFAIWTPKFNGDAPPNWKAGMAWGIHLDPKVREIEPEWHKGIRYKVPTEAVETITPEAFLAWARANRDKLPDGVAEALGPEALPDDDWAWQLFRDIQDTSGWGAPDKPDEKDLLAIELLRSRCRPIGNDTVTDRLVKALDTALSTLQETGDCDANCAECNDARALIREATQ